MRFGFLTPYTCRYYALIVGVVTFLYLYLTVRLAQWRANIRREMTNKSREEDAVKNDSMIAYETVKYFNAEEYEFGRYRGAVQAFQRAEYQVLLSLNIMNVSQNVVFTLGLMAACFLCAYQVTTGQVKVGRFVTLLTYLAQLQVCGSEPCARVVESGMLMCATGALEFLWDFLPEHPVIYDQL